MENRYRVAVIHRFRDGRSTDGLRIYRDFMQYSISVWEGPTPTSTDHAYALWKGIYSEAHPLVPPTPATAEFMRRVLARWPMADAARSPDSPWKYANDERSAAGHLADLDLTWEGARRALPFIAETAHDLGLVWWDPQVQEVRVQPSPPWEWPPSSSGTTLEF